MIQLPNFVVYRQVRIEMESLRWKVIESPLELRLNEAEYKVGWAGQEGSGQ